jgi:hypothetical protein
MEGGDSTHRERKKDKDPKRPKTIQKRSDAKTKRSENDPKKEAIRKRSEKRSDPKRS